MKVSQQVFTFRYESSEHWIEVFKTYYGPTNRAFASLDPPKQADLQADILDLLGSFNRGGNDTLIIPSEYLEAVITRA
jgi:hypothetical protein